MMCEVQKQSTACKDTDPRLSLALKVLMPNIGLNNYLYCFGGSFKGAYEGYYKGTII